jgi:class 3 adenylate cyclase/tetratricopeptide (TPR) repeat protein
MGFLTLIFAMEGSAMLCNPLLSERRYLDRMSSLGGERKIATMLFADLVGSTELATNLDPEDLRGRLEPFFQAARLALEQHGGTVEKYIGDAVMAVFGAPVSHGDDPDRAIAAALAVVDRVASLDGGLAVRVGIETGEVLAVPQAGDLTVTGEAVNAAARLQQAAGAGEVLVGERTARACRRAQLERNGAVDAKGMDTPLTAFRAVAICDEDEVTDVPLIGREDDLAMLRLIARRAKREQVPQLVTVIGEAGIGKTRLAADLFTELRNDGWSTVVGRSPPYGHGIAFWALGEILHDAAGYSTDARSDEVEPALREVLEKLGADDAAELAGALVVAMRGAEEGTDAEDELKRAWRRFVALLAADRPLAIGVDDAHWADEGTLNLLEEAAFGLSNAPVMILCTCRPELAERLPDFGRAARNHTQIELLPLDAASATRLAELLLPEDRRPLAGRIADAAGGNPFFTEEVSRAIRDEREEAVPERLPDTVQAAIAARIDLLPPPEKRALQVAAVLGHTFAQAPLEELLGEDPGDLLWSLRRRALVEERTTSDAGSYAFRHQLIKDVAYSSLPRAERATLHEQAAEALMAHEPFAERAELVAYHLDHAFELKPTPERRNAACTALADAAASAVRRGAGARGQALYEQAAELSEGSEQVDWLIAAGDVALRRWRGDFAMRLYREVGETAERIGDTRAAAGYARAVEIGTRMSGISGNPDADQLRPLLQRGNALVNDDDTITKARLLLDEAWLAWKSDQTLEMEEPARGGLELARESGDLAVLQSALDAITASDWQQGRHRSAVEHTRERLDLLSDAPRTATLDVERSDALHMMIECLLQTGDFHEAERYAREARDLDLSRGIIYSAWQRGLLPAFFLGRWDEALDMATHVREAWVAAERPPLGAFATSIASAGAIMGLRGDDGGSAWFEIADELGEGGLGNKAGVIVMKAEVELHQGEVQCAADRFVSKISTTWFRSPYLAARAEAYARLGREDTDEAILAAEEGIGEHRYGLGILLRAKGIHSGDEAKIRESMELFAELECPYQEARSGWLLGGEARGRAAEIFDRLRATPPAD